MARVVSLVLFALLLSGTPAWGQSADDEIGRLIALLAHEDASNRANGAWLLGQAGPKAAPAVSALIVALSDDDAKVRSEAVWALGSVGPRAAPAVLAITTALFDEEEDVRANAAWSVCRIGPEAASAVPALEWALSNDANARVRRIVANALGSVGPKAAPAVSALAAALSDEDPRVRVDAACALRMIGPTGASAVPALIEALSDDSVRDSAAGALCVMGLLAVPDLVTAASDENEDVRESAVQALGEISADLKTQGTVLWWVVPRVYWKEACGLLFLFVLWYWRYPRHRPVGRFPKLAFFTTAGFAPAAVMCSAVYYAITREWAQGFLPDTLTLVPFPVAAVLSTALVCALPAVWVCQRKTSAPQSDPTLEAS